MRITLNSSLHSVCFVFALTVLTGCGRGEPEKGAAAWQSIVFETIPAPVSDNGQFPFLDVGEDGSVRMSWVTQNQTRGHSLNFTDWDGDTWSNPAEIASGNDWFVNWADFPSLVSSPKGTLFAHFLQKSGSGTYAYDAMMTFSMDGGANWSVPEPLHNDQTATEHGFVSLHPVSDEQLMAVWLDGRETAGTGHDETHQGSGAMTLRASLIDPMGSFADDYLLDDRTCDCCQTSAASTKNARLVVYRDRSADEIRDISIVRYATGEWSSPRSVAQDGWEIAGCPVNGPALATRPDKAAVAWYTAADNHPTVKVAFSFDEGLTFVRPIEVDLGAPIGRVDIKFVSDDRVAVSWMESTETGALLLVRFIDTNGTMSPPVTVSAVDPNRRSGFPQLAVSDHHIWLAWTIPGTVPEVAIRRTGIRTIQKQE